jgi:hypothetical protein
MSGRFTEGLLLRRLQEREPDHDQQIADTVTSMRQAPALLAIFA